MKIIEIYYYIRQVINNYIQLRKVNKKGNNNNVFGKIDIINPYKITIGSNCSFNHGCYINAFNPITIGNDVTISAHACIVSTGIDYESWSKGKKKHQDYGEIAIGDHVWVGAGAMILSNVKITGQYVVIAAGAIVTKNVEVDHCIVAGCPAKIISIFN